MANKVALMQDVLDKHGNLTHIIAEEVTGEHIFDAHWDPRDDQTHENRQEFRKWVVSVLRNKGYQTLN
jgi:hypothetical protein